MYILTPHNYVGLCLAAYFSESGLIHNTRHSHAVWLLGTATAVLAATAGGAGSGSDGMVHGAWRNGISIIGYRFSAWWIAGIVFFTGLAGVTCASFVRFVRPSTVQHCIASYSDVLPRWADAGFFYVLTVAGLCLASAVATAAATDGRADTAAISIALAAAALVALAAFLLILSLRHVRRPRAPLVEDAAGMELVATDAVDDVGTEARRPSVNGGLTVGLPRREAGITVLQKQAQKAHRGWLSHTFRGLVFVQVLADFASCFALGTLVEQAELAKQLGGTTPPKALRWGYAITACGFLFLFGPASAMASVSHARTARSCERYPQGHSHTTRHLTCAIFAMPADGLSDASSYVRLRLRRRFSSLCIAAGLRFLCASCFLARNLGVLSEY